VDDIPGLESTDVSVRLRSDLPVVAERAMYFDYQGKTGGHNALGVNQPSSSWLFAEGYTGGGFDEYILVLNPQDEATTVNFDFMLPDGSVRTHAFPVNATSRMTVHVDDIPGLESTDVSVRLRSDLPVVAERAMYFDYPYCPGGSVNTGCVEAAKMHYLAEGYTSNYFDVYMLVMNDGDKTVPVLLTFCLPSGQKVNYPLAAAAHSRSSVLVNSIPGMRSTEFSVMVEAGGPVAVERATYFNFPR
jgi:hypothetical protein